MSENKYLDGWKEIADYLGRTVRTAQRWERELQLPIKRVKSQQSVFAIKSELEDWTNGQPGSGCEPRWPSKKKTLTVVFSLLLIFAMTALVAYSGKDDNPGSLSYRLESSRTQSTLDILNSDGAVIHTFHSRGPQFLARISEGNRGCQFFSIADLNNDGKDDVVIALDSAYGNLLELYFQREGRLVLHRSRDLELDLRYNGEEYTSFLPLHIELKDMTGDQKPEIILTQNQQHLYPSVLRVFSLDMCEMMRVWHSGRLTNCIVTDRDQDGIKEIVAAGTNNRLSEFSTPVVFEITPRFLQKMLVVDLIALFDDPEYLLPPNVQLIYVSLRKGQAPPVCKWEPATINTHHKSNQLDFLQVNTSPCLLTATSNSWVRDLVYLRCFMFNSSFRLNRAYFNKEPLTRVGMNLAYAKERRELLEPLYWNGSDWQTAFTFVDRQ